MGEMQHIFNEENSNLAKLCAIIERKINSERGKTIIMIHFEFQKTLDTLEGNQI